MAATPDDVCKVSTAHPNAQLPILDDVTLTPVVRRAVSKATIILQKWTITKIHEDYNPLIAGIYRITGTAHDGLQILPWSIVLKMVRRSRLPESNGSDWLHDPTHLLYWEREALVFQSGILDAWQGDLVPVHCYGIQKPAADLCWLWLEDVQDTPPGLWTLERHILAARHFGTFNGAFAARTTLPEYPWLTHRFLRQWLAVFGPLAVPILKDQSVWSAPAVQAALPRDLAPRILQLLADADDLLAALERLPRTLSDLDTDRRNLFTRETPGNQTKTVVIDWGFLGIAAVGEDVGNQVGGELVHLAVPAAEAARYADSAVAAYLEGLQAMGWHGQPEGVRLAALIHQLHYLSFSPLIVQAYAHERQVPPWMHLWATQHNVPQSEAFRQWGEALMFLLKQAEEAQHGMHGSDIVC